MHMGRISHTTRPVLAIDTAASHAPLPHHPSLLPRELTSGEYHSVPIPSRPIPDTHTLSSTSISSKNSGSSKLLSLQRHID